MSSLRSRKKGPARSRHACLPRAPVISFAHYFQAIASYAGYEMNNFCLKQGRGLKASTIPLSWLSTNVELGKFRLWLLINMITLLLIGVIAGSG